jgi:PelA/Pel-15E family pectate lyase
MNNGVPTVWGAQHDPVTYEPLPGRAYELASKSGSESVAVTAFLMSIPQTPEIEHAAKSALQWFDTVREDGTKYNRQGPVYFEPDAGSVIWYRFYKVDEDVPFYADRDGKKYMNILEISEERRHGYSWAGSYARNLLKLASEQGYYKLSKPLPKS